jgi:hypothetical protein
MAAPSATASSTLTALVGSFPKIFVRVFST